VSPGLDEHGREEEAPTGALWERLASRIGIDPSATAPPWPSFEPAWEDVAPGISCKILAADAARDRVSMLVRLEPGVAYPPHRHADVEELHLLDGELWINERKLFPGDFYRAVGGSSDERVWSETGCTCFLTTSPSDTLQP
jgi:ChrR Cupin-like domain